MRIAILMPNYNLGNFIREAIDSLFSQSLPQSLYHVLIIDDGSSNQETLRTLKSLNPLLPSNFSVIFEKKNSGIAKTINKYAKKVIDTHDYILVFSPDDTLHPNYLEETFNYMESSPSTAAVATEIKQFGEADGIIRIGEDDITLPNMLIRNHFCGTALIRTSVLKNEPFFYDENLPFHEDYDLWLRLLSRGETLGVIQKPLFNYRIRSSSVSRTVASADELQWKLQSIDRFSATYSRFCTSVLKELVSENHKLHNDYSSLYRELEKIDQKRVYFKSQLKITRDQLSREQKLSIMRPFRIVHAQLKHLLRNRD